MFYIAYGSNMNLDQMMFRCPNSKRMCNGELRGWKLVFNTHADIIPTGDENDRLPVVVWLIAKSDWKNLDRYEGFPRYYVKRKIPCWLDGMDKPEPNCIAYVMAENRKGFAPPYNNYLDVVMDGCKQNGIGVEYLMDAIEESYQKWGA